MEALDGQDATAQGRDVLEVNCDAETSSGCLESQGQERDSEQICHMAQVTGRKGHCLKSAIARSQMEVLEEPCSSDGRKRSLQEKRNVLVIERGHERGADC